MEIIISSNLPACSVPWLSLSHLWLTSACPLTIVCVCACAHVHFSAEILSQKKKDKCCLNVCVNYYKESFLEMKYKNQNVKFSLTNDVSKFYRPVMSLLVCSFLWQYSKPLLGEDSKRSCIVVTQRASVDVFLTAGSLWKKALKLQYAKDLQNICKMAPCCALLASIWLIHAVTSNTLLRVDLQREIRLFCLWRAQLCRMKYSHLFICGF